MTYQRESGRRLRIAVVGCGSHSYRNLLPCLHYLPVDLVALCDLDPDLLARTAAEYRVEATHTSTAACYAGHELDAVLLCVGPQQHPTLAAEALDAGLHVWLEKPAAMDLDGIRRIAAARRDDQVVVVGYKKAFMPAVAKARELVDRAEGPLKTVLAEYPMDLPADGPGALARHERHNWLANGCHPLSALLELGGPVAAVTAHRGAHGGGVVVLEYASGAIGTFHLAAGMAGPRERYSAFCDGAHVEIENSRRVTWHRGVRLPYGRAVDFAPPGDDHGSVVWESQNHLGTLENKALFTQGFYHELAEFCACVLEGRSPRTGDLGFARELTKVYEAALRSQGARIPIAVEDWRPTPIAATA